MAYFQGYVSLPECTWKNKFSQFPSTVSKKQPQLPQQNGTLCFPGGVFCSGTFDERYFMLNHQDEI